MTNKIGTGTFLVLVLLLSGCGTVQFMKPLQEPQILEAPVPTVTEAPTLMEFSLPSREIAPAAGTVYTYGRFTVMVMENGSQVIEGGVFMPPTTPPRALGTAHTIFINYLTKELTYYRLTPQGAKPVVGYAVVTPASATLPNAVVEGKVTSIDTKPTWCPTPNIRKKYPDLPAGCLPFGHPENAMGAAKFMIDWQLPKALKAEWSTVRLHGVSGYPSAKIGVLETFGCTGLQNTGLNNLISELGPNAVRAGIAIIMLKGDAFMQDAL